MAKWAPWSSMIMYRAGLHTCRCASDFRVKKSSWHIFRTAKSIFSTIFWSKNRVDTSIESQNRSFRRLSGQKIDLAHLSNRKIDLFDDFRVKKSSWHISRTAKSTSLYLDKPRKLPNQGNQSHSYVTRSNFTPTIGQDHYKERPKNLSYFDRNEVLRRNFYNKDSVSTCETSVASKTVSVDSQGPDKFLSVCEASLD